VGVKFFNIYLLGGVLLFHIAAYGNVVVIFGHLAVGHQPRKIIGARALDKGIQDLFAVWLGKLVLIA